MSAFDRANGTSSTTASSDTGIAIDALLLILFALLCIATPLVVLEVITYIADHVLPAVGYGAHQAASYVMG